MKTRFIIIEGMLFPDPEIRWEDLETDEERKNYLVRIGNSLKGYQTSD